MNPKTTSEGQRPVDQTSRGGGDPPDPLLAFRDRFPILERTNYLISNSLGAVPAEVATSLESYYQTWATRGVRAWEEAWWSMVSDLGDLVAPLIGARAGEVVFQPNVTTAHAVVFSAFDYSPRANRIVTDAMHFPSILYLLAQEERDAARLVVVPSDDGIRVDTNRVVEAIDERTAIVESVARALQVRVCARCGRDHREARRVGAISIIDGYQAVGALPVDVRALGIDVYIGGCLKWLCGGPGAAFLWADPDVRRRLEPRLTGWMAHRHPFDFDTELVRRDDAWRLLHGTPNISAFYAARPGLEIVHQAGVDAIRAKSLRQTGRLLDLADRRGLSVHDASGPGAAGRDRGDRRRERLRSLPEPQVARYPLRLSPRRRHPPIAPFLHPRQRARRSGRGHRRDQEDRRLARLHHRPIHRDLSGLDRNRCELDAALGASAR